jgi:phosphoribosyl 1,2-cyclic phosphate phosphodiesterase
MSLKVTILGSGTSQGVPMIACSCSVCSSDNSKDKRLRSSILVSHKGHNYCIDSGPDFRQQMLTNKVNRLDGIIYTHQHKDHTAGMDDVRAFNFSQKKDMPLYCTESVENALKMEFSYVFSAFDYPGIPRVQLNRIDSNPFELPSGLRVIPIQVLHHRLPVLGFRFEDFTYITDANYISGLEKNKIKGSKMLIINALRLTEHISHFTFQEALALISELKPEKAYLTHISHLFGRHDDIKSWCPENVEPCFDGMTLEMTT